MGMVAEDTIGPTAGSHEGLAVAACQVVFLDAQMAFPAEFWNLFGFRHPQEAALRRHGPAGVFGVAAVAVRAGNPVPVMPALAPLTRNRPVFGFHQVRVVAVDTDVLLNPRSLGRWGFGELFMQ